MKGFNLLALVLCVFYIPNTLAQESRIQDVNGISEVSHVALWLSHEHILVDFIGADSISLERWNKDSVSAIMLPYLEQAKSLGVEYFVEATPAYLGRDPLLLKELSERTGLKILTNTGYYGAQNNKFIPAHAFEKSPEELAALWTAESRDGLDQTGVKPGFIKISVDSKSPLDKMHQKLVKAAALTHLETGLTIASHTGKAVGLWPQLKILEEAGVSGRAFIWVHAQTEEDFQNYVKAAKSGCWISLDGLGWETERHLDRIVFAKKNGFLDQVLISHDAGWYDPAKMRQEPKGYTNIFWLLLPELRSRGFTQGDIDLLLRENPSRAYATKIRKL